MTNFQTIVLYVASIFLILLMIIMSILLYQKKQNIVYPPVIANCPDYWLDESTDTYGKCVNRKNLGNCKPAEMDFTGSFWTGTEGLCRKYKWAKECNLTWDGITNNNKICK